jgi:cytochrome c biogenesis protein CcmG/thiol:disulfide interchange protein DsbE
MRRKHDPTLLAMTLLLAAGCRSVKTDGVWIERRADNPGTLAAMHGSPAPELHLTDWINTDGVSLEQLHGNVVLLDFWGVWCGPCRALTPQLVQLHERYADDGLVIVGIHTANAAERAPAYVREHGVPYAIGFDMEGTTREAYKVDGYPDLYLVDRSGRIRFADIDQSVSGNLEAAVQKLLSETAH